LAYITSHVLKITVDISMYLESTVSVSRRLNTADACISILWKYIVSNHNGHESSNFYKLKLHIYCCSNTFQNYFEMLHHEVRFCLINNQTVSEYQVEKLN